MEKNYYIAFQKICINSPFFPEDCDCWQRFLVKGEKGNIIPENPYSETVNITCKITDDLDDILSKISYESKPSFACKSNAIGDIKGGCFNGKIIRQCNMGSSQGSLSVYKKGELNCETYLTSDSFRVMMDTRYMWHSLSLIQLLAQKSIYFLHSSYIDVNGEGILFSGQCGAGKSTQAELWRKHRGADIINGDKSAVSLENNVACVHGVPFCGTSEICGNKSLPLKAVVFLKKGDENTIKRLNGVLAAEAFLQNIYLDFLVPDELDECISFLIKLLEAVPVYQLVCTPDVRAVEELEKELINNQ